jgi:hypothetical protein
MPHKARFAPILARVLCCSARRRKHLACAADIAKSLAPPGGLEPPTHGLGKRTGVNRAAGLRALACHRRSGVATSGHRAGAPAQDRRTAWGVATPDPRSRGSPPPGRLNQQFRAGGAWNKKTRNSRLRSAPRRGVPVVTCLPHIDPARLFGSRQILSLSLTPWLVQPGVLLLSLRKSRAGSGRRVDSFSPDGSCQSQQASHPMLL